MQDSREPTVKRGCPECGAVLVTRVNGTTKERFLGCQRYPRCQYTEPLPIDVQLRELGAPMLPGFG